MCTYTRVNIYTRKHMNPWKKDIFPLALWVKQPNGWVYAHQQLFAFLSFCLYGCMHTYIHTWMHACIQHVRIHQGVYTYMVRTLKPRLKPWFNHRKWRHRTQEHMCMKTCMKVHRYCALRTHSLHQNRHTQTRISHTQTYVHYALLGKDTGIVHWKHIFYENTYSHAHRIQTDTCNVH